MLATRMRATNGDTDPGNIAVVDSATSSGTTITAPAGINSGDLIVLLDKTVSGSGGVPTGFTEIVTAIVSAFDTIMSYKISDGTDSSSTITGMSGTNTRKALYVFRLDKVAQSLTVQDLDSEASETTPSAQAITSSGGTVPLVALAGWTTVDEDIDSHNMTPTEDAEVNSDNKCYLAYKIYNSSPANITDVSMTNDNANTMISLYIELSRNA